MANAMQSFDFVIVGAGTAGCLLANRLSADGRWRVLLLEAGGSDNQLWIHIPVGYLYTHNRPKTDWCFKTGPEEGLGGRELSYPRGRVLGGSSSINGMIYMRGQARDYDLWRQQGNAGWSWEEVLPFFKRSEDHFAGASAYHGSGGEWRVEKQRLQWPILEAVRRAAAEVGIPSVDDFNTGDNEGCGYFEVNQRRGIRWNSSKAFLKPARHRPNLQVRTGVQVQRLVFEEGRCQGLDYVEAGGKVTRITAVREVVLAAGAIGSPHILQLSGIGAGATLTAAGIVVQHELPGVGANLQDHLQLRAVYGVSHATTLNTMAHSLWSRAKMAGQYALFRKGPLTMAPSQLGAFTRSDPRFETPNVQFHVQPLSLDRFDQPLHRFPAVTASICNLRPTSRGTVTLRTADPLAPPSITPHYLSTDEDCRVAVESLRLVRRLMSAPALAPHQPAEIRPGDEAQSDDDLLKAARQIGTTIFHPVGTCKMGPASDGAAVVDARLRVHGVGGLRIVDASIMPTITSGNTNSPTLMIAEKASAMILEDSL